MKKFLIAICLIGCSTLAFADYHYTIINTYKDSITCSATDSTNATNIGSVTIPGNKQAQLTVNSQYEFNFFIDCLNQPQTLQSLFPFDGSTSPMPGDGLTLKFSAGPGKYDSSLTQV